MKYFKTAGVTSGQYHEVLGTVEDIAQKVKNLAKRGNVMSQHEHALTKASIDFKTNLQKAESRLHPLYTRSHAEKQYIDDLMEIEAAINKGARTEKAVKVLAASAGVGGGAVLVNKLTPDVIKKEEAIEKIAGNLWGAVTGKTQARISKAIADIGVQEFKRTVRNLSKGPVVDPTTTTRLFKLDKAAVEKTEKLEKMLHKANTARAITYGVGGATVVGGVGLAMSGDED